MTASGPAAAGSPTPVATRLIDAGGYRLAVEVRGRGEPAIVCVSGLTGDHSEWVAVAPKLAATTTVLTYVRAGREGSDPLPEHLRSPWSAGRAAEELHAMLASTDVAPPYILTGHSIGGLFAAVYASRWPEEIAGLVLLDPTDPLFLAEFDRGLAVEHPDGAAFDWAAMRADFLALDLPGVPAVVVCASPGAWLGYDGTDKYLPLTPQLLDDGWQAAQRAWALRAGARLAVAARAGHCVHVDEPELVVKALTEVVTAARAV